MTDMQDPWHALSPGGVDARRVDPDGRHDFFWIISGKGEKGILLRAGPDEGEPTPLPKLRSLDLTYQDVGGNKALVLLLRDAEQKELFHSLCIDIVRAADAAEPGAGALGPFVRRAMRWHHLLRGGGSDLLSLEEQRGLLGELQFLERLIDQTGAYAAIEAWKGPSGSSKDFELDGCLVELKARRGAAKPFVQISSEDQLSDVEGCELYLVVSAVDAAIKPAGKTLTDYVLDLEKLFAAAEPDAYRLWELAIAETGFSFEDDYSGRRWTLGKTVEFRVGEGFPRITPPLIAGVSGVRYSIALDACEPFRVEPGALDACIAGGGASDGRGE